MSMAAEKPVEIPIEEQIKMCIALSEIIEFLLGLVLYVYQRSLVNRLIEAVLRAEGDEILVLQSRQSGKTEGVTVTPTSTMVVNTTGGGTTHAYGATQFRGADS